MKGVLLIAAVISSVPFKGCGEFKSLKPVQYVKWVEDIDNGLKVEKLIGDYMFAVQYKPLEYCVLKAERNLNISEQEMNAKMKEIEGLQYFTFQISTKNGSGELLRSGINDKDEKAELEKRIDYFSSKMQNDIKLIDGQDTLHCVLFHFERTYNLTPYSNFNLGFEYGSEEKSSGTTRAPLTYKSKRLVYNDHAFNAGAVELMIKEENLNKIPNLITQ